jgi:crossover junction endonuclease EME1
VALTQSDSTLLKAQLGRFRRIMTIEVIDLVSSPERPQLTTSKISAKEKTATRAKTNPPKQSLTYERPKRAEDDWYTILSDNEVETLGIPDKPALNATARKAEKLKPSFDTSTKPSQHLQTSNPVSDVYFHSDDFDSTVNFDDPFEIEMPPTKKSRTSLSPKAAPPPRAKFPKASGFQRSVSNIESSYRSGPYESSADGLRRSNTLGTVLESDPIVFTSSPDPFEDAVRRRREKRKEVLDGSDEDAVFRPRPPTKDTVEKRVSHYDISDGSSDMDLPDLDEIPGKGISQATVKRSSLAVLENYNAGRVREQKAKEAAEKTEERQVKLATKDAERERKRLEKEEKANEKERLAELARVNVVRTSKQRSSHEMIIDLPSKLAESALGEQTLKLLGKAEIKHSSWESSLPVIKWRREVSSEYNEEIGQWEPVSLHIKNENHIMFVVSAKEFVELATGEEGQDIGAHVLGLKARFPSSDIIYLIQGLTAWVRKNKTIQNRKFTETVRNQTGLDEPAATQKPRKKKQEEYVDEDLVEDALLRLQVIHGALIHHTAAMIETAEWILVFTQHISTRPYRSVLFFFPSQRSTIS